MNVTIFLTLLGTILLLGVLGNFFFYKIRVPTSVMLMIIGIVIGPLTGWLNGADFKIAAPFFGTIALILILFEGGLEIDLFEAVGQARSAVLLGLVHFILGVTGVFLLARFGFQISSQSAIFYGLVLGGTSPAVVLPVLQNLGLSQRGKALFGLETVISEVLTVVGTILAIDFWIAQEPPSVLGASLFVFHSFGTATWIAVLAAWGWNWVIPFVEKSGMSHMVTLAFLFLLYALAASLHAEPAVTVLVFGLLLENGHHVSEWLMKWLPEKLHRWIDFPVKNEKRMFSALFFELSFLIRTFFFVIVGLLFDFRSMTVSTYIVGAACVGLFFIARKGSLFILRKMDTSFGDEEFRIGLATLPRGLATAVVALLVNQAQVPGTENLVPLAFLCILGTNLLMALLLRRTGLANV